jgi:predicted negative regulator of RcsB-dependent stress response
MPRPKESLRGRPVLKELFFLIIGGLITLSAYLGWRYFHHETTYSENPQTQERAESLTDH